MTGRGSIRLVEPSCTSCMVCARECPTWCITIDSHTEVLATDAPGGRPRTTHVLDRFAIDWSLCMYCGICVDECPFDALEWIGDAVPAGPGLLQELASPLSAAQGVRQHVAAEQLGGGQQAPGS